MKEFLLDGRLTFSESLEDNRFEICSAPTRRDSSFGVLLAEVHHLCDAHVTRDTVAMIMRPLP